MKSQVFVKDQIVTYKGRGFLGFDKQNTSMKFIRTANVYDAYCKYVSSKCGEIEVLVSIYEIE